MIQFQARNSHETPCLKVAAALLRLRQEGLIPPVRINQDHISIERRPGWAGESGGTMPEFWWPLSWWQARRLVAGESVEEVFRGKWHPAESVERRALRKSLVNRKADPPAVRRAEYLRESGKPYSL
jgi:hypothetical protein